MKKFSLDTLALELLFAVRRIDPIACIAVLLCVAGFAASFGGISHVRTEVAERQRMLQHLEQKFNSPHELAVKAPPVSAGTRLAQFYDALGEKDYAEQPVKTLFAMAEKSGLRLDQSEYKWSYDKVGRFYTYQISLPVKGGYLSIRSFCEQVLIAIPFISLDEVNFKRDGASASNLEAKLRFTLYFADPALLPKSRTPSEAS